MFGRMFAYITIAYGSCQILILFLLNIIISLQTYRPAELVALVWLGHRHRATVAGDALPIIMGEFKLLNSKSTFREKISPSIMAFILWLLTTVLAFWEIFVIREIALRLYVHFLPIDIGQRVATSGAGVLGAWIFLPLVILFIAIAIGGAEYHYKRVGQPDSWQLFSRTLAVELAILALALFI